MDGKKVYDDSKVIDNPDTVEGIVLLQKGDDSDPVLHGIHDEVDKLNGDKDHPGILPKGVKVVPFLDRSDLVRYTVNTVEHNLTAGMILVSIILFLFLGNVRGAIIVALTIPFALLFASICLDLSHIPANLLSLGALDFGMVVDGSVVMIENIVRHLSQHDAPTPRRKASARPRTRCSGPSSSPAASSSPPTCPSSPCRPSRAGSSSPWPGRSALPCSARWSSPSLVAPVMASMLFSKGAKEWHNPVMLLAHRTHYRAAVRAAIEHRRTTLGIAAGAVRHRHLSLLRRAHRLGVSAPPR